MLCVIWDFFLQKCLCYVFCLGFVVVTRFVWFWQFSLLFDKLCNSSNLGELSIFFDFAVIFIICCWYDIWLPQLWFVICWFLFCAVGCLIIFPLLIALFLSYSFLCYLHSLWVICYCGLWIGCMCWSCISQIVRIHVVTALKSINLVTLSTKIVSLLLELGFCSFWCWYAWGVVGSCICNITRL